MPIAFVDEEVSDFYQHYRLIQKNKIAVDLAKGGPVAFATIKDKKIPPVTHLEEAVKATVKRTKWLKEGVKAIEIQHCPECIDLTLPASFQNQECMAVTQATMQEHSLGRSGKKLHEVTLPVDFDALRFADVDIRLEWDA